MCVTKKNERGQYKTQKMAKIGYVLELLETFTMKAIFNLSLL